MAVVLRLPALELDRLVVAHRVGGEPALERGEIDERLERRAGLALRRDRAVELALGVVLAADQRAHRALRRHRDQRALLDVELLALLRQHVDQRFLRRRLQRRIDRGLDHDVLVEPADQLVDRVHHPVGHVVDRAAGRRVDDARRMRQRDLDGARIGEAVVGHRGEHELRPLLGAVEVLGRREPRRRLDQAGEQRGLGQRHALRRLAEVALRRRLDAVGAGAEIDAVEIELEDLLLGELVLEPDRQHHLLQLARHRALLRQEEVLGQLLGDGRAALRDAASQHVGDHGAHEAERVDAVVRVEPPVLDRQERLRQVGRHLLERDRGAAHLAAVGEHAAVERDDLHRRRPLRHLERLDRRQVVGDPEQQADAGDHAPQRGDRRPVEHPSDQRAAAALGPAALLAGAARPRRALGGRGLGRGLGPLAGSSGLSRHLPHAPSCDSSRPFAHVPAKWTPVRRQGHAQKLNPRAHSDSAGTECALPHANGLDLRGRYRAGGRPSG